MRTESLTQTFAARLPLLVPSCRSLISCTCNVTTDPVSLRACVFLSHTLAHKGREQRATIILWVWDNGRAVQMWCEGLWGEWYGHTHSYNLLAGDITNQPSSEIRGVTAGNPSWALAWILSAKGECQPAGLFRCHRRVCVCVWLRAQTHTHILRSENECVLSGGFLSGNQTEGNISRWVIHCHHSQTKLTPEEARCDKSTLDVPKGRLRKY